MKRVGIVGSREYTNRRKIKEFVFKLKEQFGDKVEIVSGGQKLGADGLAKKFALEFDMKYVEFPPRHYTYNQHCILDESHYGKRYFPKNFFEAFTTPSSISMSANVSREVRGSSMPRPERRRMTRSRTTTSSRLNGLVT